MKHTMRSRLGRAALAGLVVAGLGACSTFDNILEVQNPEELDVDLLGNENLVNVLVNSVAGDFDEAFDDPFVWRGSMFTDEQITGINWEATARLSQRLVEFDEGDPDLMFTQLSVARQQADSVSGRLRAAGINDARLAKTLAYAGYSYILLADAMCESTVNVGSQLYQPLELYQFAVDRFNEALTVATANNDAALANLARVGLTRAHLNLGNNSQVISIAQQVPADFKYWAEYTGDNTAIYNALEGTVVGANHSLGIHPNFVAGGRENFGKQKLEAFLTDPRVQHRASWRLGHNQSTKLYTPYAGLMMSNYNGKTIAAGETPASFERDTDIAFASGLDAMHNMYEAMGPTAATLAFVNQRRAVGNQPPVTLAGNDLIMELRNQRGRDLLFAGHRLGDLRRWLRGGTDMFPSGPHANELWGNYGSATCFPLPREEYEGNPNINLPT